MPPPEGELNLFCEPLSSNDPKLVVVDVGGGPEPELTEKTPKLEVVDDGGGPEPELTEKTLFLLFSREEARLCLPLAPIETCELEPFYWIYIETQVENQRAGRCKWLVQFHTWCLPKGYRMDSSATLIGWWARPLPIPACAVRRLIVPFLVQIKKSITTGRWAGPIVRSSLSSVFPLRNQMDFKMRWHLDMSAQKRVECKQQNKQGDKNYANAGKKSEATTKKKNQTKNQQRTNEIEQKKPCIKNQPNQTKPNQTKQNQTKPN